jgi:hypothetical protein
VDIDGQRLHIRYAIDATIDQQMTGLPEAIADSQLAFAERLTAFAEQDEEASIISDQRVDASLYSATSDGSIFSVSVE